MGENVLYFEIASIPIYIILIIATFSRRLTKGRTNVLLFIILIFAFIASFTDTIGNLMMENRPLTQGQALFIKIVNYVYFASRSGMNAAYTYYLFSVTRTWHLIKQVWKKAVVAMPYIISLVLLVFNEKTKDIFYVTTELGYQRGEKILIMYGLAAIYMLFGMIYLFIHIRLLSRVEWLSVASLYVFNVIGVLIQYFYSNLFVECYFASITLLFVVLFVQKPERQIDMNTLLPGYFAFKEQLGKIKITGQKVQIIVVHLDNAEELFRYLGEETYYDYIHLMERADAAYGKKEGIDYELYFESPGNFYLILEDLEYNLVQAIPEIRDMVRKKSGNISETGMRVELKIASIMFPDDISDVKELLWFGHHFQRFTGGKIFYHASQIIAQRDYQIETRLDEILNRAIDNQKLKIGFTPIWSSAENKPVLAEAATILEDDIFGEIDAETLSIASKARGSNALLEEYVIEQLFANVENGILTKYGLSYVVVHLSTTLGMQKNFTDKIWNLRSKYNIHPEQICFAFTEPNNENMAEGFDENIKKLSLQGYKLALDGFGKGYNNTKHIAELPISYVRLDISLVKDAVNEKGRAVLSGLIKMLNGIPLMVVAPGVDNTKTMAMLDSMGCKYMQGSIFGKIGDDN